MNIARLIATVLLIPLYLIMGAILGEKISSITGIWEEYIFAIMLPLLGIFGTWFVAPYEKIMAVTGMYITGMILAFFIVFPSYYPEGHLLAYQPTYIPFGIVSVWGLLIIMVLTSYQKKVSRDD